MLCNMNFLLKNGFCFTVSWEFFGEINSASSYSSNSGKLSHDTVSKTNVTEPTPKKSLVFPQLQTVMRYNEMSRKIRRYNIDNLMNFWTFVLLPRIEFQIIPKSASKVQPAPTPAAVYLVSLSVLLSSGAWSIWMKPQNWAEVLVTEV